jgi:dTDP-glucose 4,6-dehydratase
MFLDIDHQNILVTGGAGFMGSSFIRHMLALPSFRGKIINYDALTYCGNLENLKDVYEDKRYSFVHGNILNQKLLEDICSEEEISLIVHFAAETHVDRSIEEGWAFLQTNVLGTCCLLEVVKKLPSIHFHHISTDEVYGSLGTTGVFSEDSPYLPNSPYAASKASSDHFVRSYAKTYKLSTTISHAGNNYGPYQFPEKLIPFMIMRLLNKQPLPVYGKGENIRDWLYVEDHSKAIETILRKGKAGEVYNISNSKEMKNIDLLKLLIHLYADITKQDRQSLETFIVFVKDRPGHDFRYAMETKKIKQLEWRPSVTLEEGLEKTIQWYVEHQEWLKRLQSEEHEQWVRRHYQENVTLKK